MVRWSLVIAASLTGGCVGRGTHDDVDARAPSSAQRCGSRREAAQCPETRRGAQYSSECGQYGETLRASLYNAASSVLMPTPRALLVARTAYMLHIAATSRTCNGPRFAFSAVRGVRGVCPQDSEVSPYNQGSWLNQIPSR
jgi:hypothetical protein